jgi:peptide/nickel transport system substrate-binding protein
MTAADVAASFQSSWAGLPAASNFITKTTKIAVVDDLTLTFTTPQPQGNLPYALANWNFVIHKPAVNDISIMTGPYRPVRLEKDQSFTLERYAEYWGGAAALDRIVVTKIPDANARALALQSGDLDVLTNVPPDLAAAMPDDIERVSAPGTRMHFMILNHGRAPFNDIAVRRAASFAVDRGALIAATLNGEGAAAVNLYPASVGIPLVPAQTTDQGAAVKALDEAGWVVGADGVRKKGDDRLAFTLYSYPGRPELTQMAVAMQAQLKTVGFDVKVEEVKDITAQIKDGAFQASMFSIGIQADPQYAPGVTLISTGSFNYGAYKSDEIDALFDKLKTEPDPENRFEIATEMQQIVKNDVPNLYLATPPLITAFKRGRVLNYVHHPDDLYVVTPVLAVSR